MKKNRILPFDRLKEVLQKTQSWSAPRIIIVSFLSILLPSALLLMHPIFSVTGLSFVDALFTATSAISVTGLGVVDTGQHFTIEGKFLLLFLIQIGGLGQMTLSALLLYVLGVKMGLRQQFATREELGQTDTINIKGLVKRIVTFAIIAELIGAIFLAFKWIPEMGFYDGAGYAIFHSVSAFNNAGFSFFSDSMVSFVNDPVVTLTIALLIILGGLGFTVVLDVANHKCRSFNKLQIHSKVMLIATPVLLLIGTLLFWFLERNNVKTLAELGLWQQWMAAFFQSVSARTAGFNSIDLGAFTHASTLVMMILMLIGAGSTSTGGGIKVSTFAIAAVATWSFLRQRDYVVIFKRTIPWQTVTKCLAIIVVSFVILVLAMFLLMITENAPFDRVMFEVVSAFATVGVTAGLTANLTETGKIIMVVVMFVGRIGPLTLAYLLTQSKKKLLKYPEGKILAG